jgi:hypothetical protein
VFWKLLAFEVLLGISETFFVQCLLLLKQMFSLYICVSAAIVVSKDFAPYFSIITSIIFVVAVTIPTAPRLRMAIRI